MTRFAEMSLAEIENFLVSLGFEKLGDEKKKSKGFIDPYSITQPEWQLITYAHPERLEKVKITIMYGKNMVQSDCGKRQQTAWKNLYSTEELKEHFKL